MTLSTQEHEAILRLAQSDGWDVLSERIQQQIQTATRRLTEGSFKDLSEVSRLQGEITGLRWVLTFVNNRLNKAQKGD